MLACFDGTYIFLMIFIQQTIFYPIQIFRSDHLYAPIYNIIIFRITQIAVAPAGFAIATSSWDQNIRVWGL